VPVRVVGWRLRGRDDPLIGDRLSFFMKVLTAGDSNPP
jgi:hypothetical protein